MIKINLICICFATAFYLSKASSANCLGEAQIIAEVASKKTDNLTTCSIKIELNSVKLYNQNLVCPMDLSEIIQRGIEVGLTNGHDCNISVGDQINGVVYKRIDGKIVLE